MISTKKQKAVAAIISKRRNENSFNPYDEPFIDKSLATIYIYEKIYDENKNILSYEICSLLKPGNIVHLVCNRSFTKCMYINVKIIFANFKRNIYRGKVIIDHFGSPYDDGDVITFTKENICKISIYSKCNENLTPPPPPPIRYKKRHMKKKVISQI